MSSNTELQQELVGPYISRSSNVLFLFDCLITMSQEVDAIWSRKWTATTWLYALTRYGAVLEQIVLLTPAWNLVSCTVGEYIDEVLQLLQYLCLAWFSALRVYALLDGKYIMAGIVLLLNLVPFGTNMYSVANTVVVEDPVICTTAFGISDNAILSLSLITRISVIIGDVLVLIVTWTKSAQAYREARQLHIRAPLATVLFRDGTIYFLLLLAINILDVIEENTPILLAMDVIEPFFTIFPSMIVCHFILSLRQIEPAGSSWASGNQSHSLRFVGNMGQSLQFGGEGADDDEKDILGVKPISANGSLQVTTDSVAGDGETANVQQLGHSNGTDIEAQQSTAYFDPRA